MNGPDLLFIDYLRAIDYLKLVVQPDFYII
jgi:hypothetical protein